MAASGMKVLVTGGAGFIGMYVSRALVEEGHDVIIVDNLNDYYSPELKCDRLMRLGFEASVGDKESCTSSTYRHLSFIRGDIVDKSFVMDVFGRYHPELVVHLAAQGGVRYSLDHPDIFIQSNVVGFLNVLEASRCYLVKHLVFASSSSVYGLNGKQPYSPHDSVSHPVSLYGATKIADEVMAHAYSHLFGIPCTGMRFFTVYGPWGRPDMSPFLFADAISKGIPLKVYNHGRMRRDFTYIDDVVSGVMKICHRPPQSDASWDNRLADCATSSAPFAIYNIGNTHPVSLEDYVKAFEEALGKKANKEYLPLQSGDVLDTFSDMSDMERDFGFRASVDVQEGVRRYVMWYRKYYDR